MTKARNRAQVCANPRCTKGDDGGRKVFVSSNPAMYCCQACRQAVRYERMRLERLAELGLLRRRRTS